MALGKTDILTILILNNINSMNMEYLFIYLCLSQFFSGEGNGNPLQYSCLGSLMDEGA